MQNSLPKRIVYTRHPECVHNINHEEALRQGIENRKSPLTTVGELKRDITAAYLRREFPDIGAVFCSTYSRTHTIPVAAGMERLLREDALLDERNMGVWHQYQRAKVLELYPGEDARLKAAGYYAYRGPGGESCPDVEDRLVEFVSSGVLPGPDSTVYISGHGNAGLCLRRVLTGGSVEDWHSWRRLKNASVSVYERTGNSYICTAYNIVPWEGLIDPALMVKDGSEA